MTEKELLDLWNRARTHLVVAQLAPTFLLITTVGLVPAIRDAGTFAVLATLGILLASGILGALVEFAAAHEAQAVARDLAAIAKPSHASLTIIRFAQSEGAHAVALTGRDGGTLGTVATLHINVVEQHMGRIEDAHLAICHMLAFSFIDNES